MFWNVLCTPQKRLIFLSSIGHLNVILNVIQYCYTSRGALVGMRNSSMGPPWGITPTHRTISECSYHRATSHSSLLWVSLRTPYFPLNTSCDMMVRWVVGSILHGVDPLSYFSFQPVLHDWCNKGCGMCYPVCGMVRLKEPLLLIDTILLHQSWSTGWNEK